MLRHFGEDLEALENCSSGVQVSASHIRQLLAPVLRRWFIEGQVFKVQQAIGHKIIVNTAELRKMIRACERGEVFFFAGVRGHVGGFPLGQILLGKHGKTLSLPATSIEIAKLTLNEFAKQKVLFANDVFATRLDVIRYVANKWGGVHLDQKLDPTQSMIDEFRYYFGFKHHSDRLEFTVNFDGQYRLQKKSFSNDFIDVALLSLLNSAQDLCSSLELHKPAIQKLAGEIL